MLPSNDVGCKVGAELCTERFIPNFVGNLTANWCQRVSNNPFSVRMGIYYDETLFTLYESSLLDA
jgi:hypothetical protein